MMTNAYLEKLSTCASHEEVWQYMRGRIFPKSNNSKFEDPIIYLSNNRKKYTKVELPTDLMGLTIRLLIYLKLDGQMGNTPIGGGVSSYALHTRGLFKSIVEIKYVDKPNNIDVFHLDQLIINATENNYKAETISQKTVKLREWLSINHRLPFFLRLNQDIFATSTEYTGFEARYRKENQQKELGGGKPSYPLASMKIIVSEAIHYIESYASDSIIVAKAYKTIKNSHENGRSAEKLSVEFYQSDTFNFSEPTLKAMQIHCRSLKSKNYVTNPNTGGPRNVMFDTVNKLQEACVVVVLMLTGMRSQELDLLKRYPEIMQSEHHDLDNSFNLSRIIYKTANNDNGESLTMPIPQIAAVALRYLSELSEISDGKKTGNLNFTSFRYEKEDNGSQRINMLVNSHCKRLGIDKPPTAHQFRHAMAFIIAHLNDRDGLELARKFLGHKSIEMTKRYMGHFNGLIKQTLKYIGEYNPMISEALLELQQIESLQIFDKEIAKELAKNNPLYGPVVKRFTQFQGNITNEFKQILLKTIRVLIETNRLAIIQTPTNFCVHDLTNPEQMACQRGYTNNDFTGAAVNPSACEGANCSCSLFTIQHVEALKAQSELFMEEYPEELRERLSTNTYFVDDGLQNQYINIIKQYNEDMEKRR